MAFTNDKFAHKPGKIKVKPRKMIIKPENQDQKLEGISINKVEALSSKVKKITEKAKVKIIVIARREILLFSPGSAAPITIGSKGKMQGAKRVNTPAKIEMIKNTIT